MPRPGPRRPRVTLRISEAGIAHIDDRAEKAGRSRSDELRAMLAYASAKMPQGWSPPK